MLVIRQGLVSFIHNKKFFHQDGLLCYRDEGHDLEGKTVEGVIFCPFLEVK